MVARVTVILLYSLCFINLSFQQLNTNDEYKNLKDESLIRHKRMITKNHAWENGIVPYIYTSTIGASHRLEIEAAIEYVERYTCIKFVPWTNETRTRYNIGHNGYVKFLDAGSCYAHIGNRRQSQDCSCCDRNTCIHELGHVLGLYHSQHSNKKEGWLRINWHELMKSHLNVYRVEKPEGFIEYNYDITSMMHYPEYMYKTGYRVTSNNLVKELKIGGNRFYPIRDINWFHKCKDKRCSWFQKKCENDGYITTVRGKCDCLCPLRLDPTTGCTTIIKQRHTYSWPSGHFALMAAYTGCPEGKFGTGSLTHWGDGRNWNMYSWGNQKNRQLRLKGVHNSKRHTYYFCISKNYSPLGREWPGGSYCILREGGICPNKFKEGSIQFDDEIRSRREANSRQGQLPDGVFGNDTLLEFCCRNDGIPQQPLELPNDKPLILFQAKALSAGTCQQISGMSYQIEFFVFDNVNGGVSKFTGAVPRNVIYKKTEEFLVYYCYYEPVDYNCGDVIHLDAKTPSVVITTPNYPDNYNRDQECWWLIKAPKDMKLLMFFEDFDVERGNPKHWECLDSVRVGVGHIGQYGRTFCGSWNREVYQSIYHTLNIKFRSSQTGKGRGFNATVSVITEESMCYLWSDHGKTYRGRVNITETHEQCLLWAEVTDCPHHPFKHGDYEDGLEGNYCRNPGDGLRPWCYTQKDGCERQYCNVCLKGRFDDRISDCEELQNKTADFCTADFRAVSYCPKTCKPELPLLPPVIRVNDIRCTSPSTVKDGIIMSDIKTSYRVGDTVTYKCTETDEVLTRTCLTDRSWTFGGFVCGACPKDWAVFRKYCYKFFDIKMNWVKARNYCEVLGGELTTAVDPTEQAFLVSIRVPLRSTWLGLTDWNKEGIFVWNNGQVARWTNFYKANPANKNKNCVLLFGEENNNRWDDKFCEKHDFHPFICKIKPKGRFVCEDRLRNCGTIIQESPAMCVIYPDFAWSECPKTCGMCDKHLPKRCTIPPTPNDVVVIASRRHLYRGRVIRYSCRNGYSVVSGNLDRACLANGILSGSPPVCIPINMTISLNTDLVMKDRGAYGDKEFIYTGKTQQLLIPRHGRILQWHFYSNEPGEIALQIYRSSANRSDAKYTLISSKLLKTETSRIQVIKLSKAEQTVVQEGDMLGVWYGEKDAGISLHGCNTDYLPSNGVRRKKFSRSDSFKTGGIIDFTGQETCQVISVRVLIGAIED